jgi:DNA invertase Pin-like site-specific DNA recombinase
MMTTKAKVKIANRVKTFEDLRGLRGAPYYRDSTEDQKNGFGPDIQKHNEERFAQTWGIILGDLQYTEFVSGRSAIKRLEFQRVLQDARLDLFDVLLVDHTSRFGRNQAECIRYKQELQDLGKTVIFVSQGIISGSDKDFLNERINETLDEQYSRNLSRYVSEGLERKIEHGLHIGPAPFGYKSELQSGQPERKVPNPLTMPGLLTLLRDYAPGKLSQHEVSEHLNSLGYRTHNGNTFTGHTIMDILHNRFYEGKLVYHKGLPDEKIIDGNHEVSPEVRELWLKCQLVKSERRVSTRGQPRGPARHFPFSKVLRCQRCHQPYYGETVYQAGNAKLRLSHERHNQGRYCDAWPRSQSAETLNCQFQDRVLQYLVLPDNWKDMIIAATRCEDECHVDPDELSRIQRAMVNLKKQYEWGHIADDDYLREYNELERRKQQLSPPPKSGNLLNLERGAELLMNMPVLWSHSGVTNEQREALTQRVSAEITIDGKQITEIKPNPTYAPLFATIPLNQEYGYCKTEPLPAPPISEMTKSTRSIPIMRHVICAYSWMMLKFTINLVSPFISLLKLWL